MVYQGMLILFSLRFCFLISFFFVTSSTFEKKTPKFEGALKVNSMLTKTERLFEGKVFGPESMAVDSKGKYNLYLYLLTDSEGWTGKYLAWGCEVIIRTQLGKVSLL